MSFDPIKRSVGLHDVQFGQRVQIVEPVNLYGCVLADDCFVGPFVEIQNGVSVGARTRIQSHSFLCEGVMIGADCFIGHGVMFINDRFSAGGPAGGDTSKWEKTAIGNNVSIGSNATILPVSICDNVVIGAGAVVTKNISLPGIYAGNPAKQLTTIPSTLNPNHSTPMNIAVIGTGYVGLVSGTCFAETGNNVTCVDIDERKVSKLSSGEITIYEPGLEKLFERNLKEGRLRFTTSLAEGIKGAEIIFLALPTPPGEDGSADLRYILGVAADLGRLLRPDEYKVIVDKSTVPVGTAYKVRAAILKTFTELNPQPSTLNDFEGAFDVVSNPEFLREGAAVEDFMKPDRVVIGTRSEKARKVMQQLYEPFVRQGNPIIFMDEKSAELTKYAANSFLATKISFMNEIAVLCEKLGSDVDMVRRGIGTDFRIGKHFLYPGLGYGGSCFPKDVLALSKSAIDAAYDFKILNAVMEVNRLQKCFFIDKIERHYKSDLKGKHFAVWGLAFKPNTDDIREAPALEVIDYLLEQGATVCAFDPEAMGHVKKMYGDRVGFAEKQYDALVAADALIICTEWNEFRTPDFDRIAQTLKAKLIFDGRNLYDVDSVRGKGFVYQSIGRGNRSLQ